MFRWPCGPRCHLLASSPIFNELKRYFELSKSLVGTEWTYFRVNLQAASVEAIPPAWHTWQLGTAQLITGAPAGKGHGGRGRMSYRRPALSRGDRNPGFLQVWSLEQLGLRRRYPGTYAPCRHDARAVFCPKISSVSHGVWEAENSIFYFLFFLPWPV
jgi:hypothetical protein